MAYDAPYRSIADRPKVNSQGGNTEAAKFAKREHGRPGIRLGSYFLPGVLVISSLGIGRSR